MADSAAVDRLLLHDPRARSLIARYLFSLYLTLGLEDAESERINARHLQWVSGASRWLSTAGKSEQGCSRAMHCMSAFALTLPAPGVGSFGRRCFATSDFQRRASARPRAGLVDQSRLQECLPVALTASGGRPPCVVAFTFRTGPLSFTQTWAAEHERVQRQIH